MIYEFESGIYIDTNTIIVQSPYILILLSIFVLIYLYCNIRIETDEEEHLLQADKNV